MNESVEMSGPKSLKIVMLVNNPCKHDTRVIREAEALGEAGHCVLVLAHRQEGMASKRHHNKVKYHHICVNRIQRRAAQKTANNAKKDTANRQGESSERPKSINASGKKAGVKQLDTILREALILLLTGTAISLVRYAYHYTPNGISFRPNVVHAHDLYTLLAGYLIARKTGAKLIYDSHELEIGRNGNFSRWERWWRARFERLLIARTDDVITVCDSIADYLQNLYKIERPIVILNAPQVDHQSESDDHIRTKIGLNAAAPLAIYIGALTSNRGLENCVHSLTHAGSLQIAMIGPRTNEMEQKLVRLAEDLDVRQRLHLVDAVPPNEVISFVRSADVSLILIQNVCLSYKFCFPNKLLESMFAGVPVVVSRLVELKKMVELTSVGLVVDETDPAAIAKSAMKIIDNKKKFLLSQSAIVHLHAEYGWDKQKSKLLELYHKQL